MNSQSMSRYLYSLHCELWDLESLEPNEFACRVQVIDIFSAGSIIAIIQEGIRHYQHQRAIIKYIHIVDKLLKVPSFAGPMQHVIIDLYYQIFISFWNQKCYNELEQLKILRKYWVGKVHPLALTKIRHLIYQTTNIDVDEGFRQDVITSIKSYYQNRLRMTPEQINMHLPRPKQLEIPKRGEENERSPATDLPDLPDYTEQSQFPKRRRSFSEIAVEDLPRKIMHVSKVADKQESVNHKVIDMLNKLRESHRYECVICGMRFLSEQKYGNHLNDHFLQNRRLSQLKSKRIKNGTIQNQKPYNCSEDQWMEEQQTPLSLDKFCVVVQDINEYNQQYICPFCGCNINQVFKDQKWVYVAATKVEIKHQILIAHQKCLEEILPNHN